MANDDLRLKSSRTSTETFERKLTILNFIAGVRWHPRGAEVDPDGGALHAVLQVAPGVPDGGGAGRHHLQGSNDLGKHSLIIPVYITSGQSFCCHLILSSDLV